ncbi:MAG: serine protease [Gammaproteobacteria bacterium]|nr:serine protease [Gammaproteobacteria bacterium]
MPVTKSSRLTIIFMLIAGLSPIASSAAENLDIAGLMKERSAALVTVKYVLAVNMGGSRGNQENENENELTCTMIRADGLIVCSNNQLGGFVNILTRISGQLGKTMSATPKNFEVIVDSHEQAFDAEIIAVDTELDIAWIQITDTRDTSFSFVDFSTGATVDIGDTVITLRRTGNHFGRTLVAGRNHVGGITDKPRKLYLLESAFANGGGLPGFDGNGKVIGLMVTQLPEATETSGAGMGFMGSGMANIQEALSGVILPAREIAKATQRAMEVESY